jgi:hypothetical protein
MSLKTATCRYERILIFVYVSHLFSTFSYKFQGAFSLFAVHKDEKNVENENETSKAKKSLIFMQFLSFKGKQSVSNSFFFCVYTNLVHLFLLLFNFACQLNPFLHSFFSKILFDHRNQLKSPR